MVAEVQWSELQRDPKQVAKLAETGAVRVRRRDGAPLLLIREDDERSVMSGALAAARTLRTVFAHVSPDDLLAGLIDEFSWLDLLPDADQREFLIEFVRSFQTSAETGRWDLLDQTMLEWRNTAAVHADSTLAKTLAEPIVDDLGPVSSPVA